MSPEQALGQVDEIDARTDQWALACIAWEALSGQGPFVGESVPSLLFQVVHETPAPLQPKVPDLRPEVEQVLRLALSKNKDGRFPSVADFSIALEGAVTGAAAAAAPQPPAMGASDVSASTVSATGSADGAPKSTTFSLNTGELEPPQDNPRSKPRGIWAIVGAAAVALLFGAFLLFRHGPNQAADGKQCEQEDLRLCLG